ncbi:MAG: restriction endonuclease subunit S [Erythrobacter sp.]|nr:restriction endonuclease subunit S [Erythrobacter sp.]
MLDWPIVEMGDYAEFQEGYVNPPQGNRAFFDGPINWLRAVDLNDGYVSETSRTLSHEGLKSAGKSAFLFPAETLAISKSGTIGRVGYLRIDAAGNRAVINVRPDRARLLPLIAMYALRAGRAQVETLAEGSVQKNLYVSALRQFKFRLPPIRDQHGIVELVSSIDDKIELNRRMNETLEAQAQALFRDWFVDFGPVKAKMAGPDAGAGPYLAPDLWSLFPNRLDDNGVPKGWRAYRVDEIANHHTKSLKPMDAASEVFEHFSLPAYDSGQQPALEMGDSIKSSKTIVPEGAILLSKLNPEISRVWWPQDKGAVRQIASTEFLAFTAKGDISPALLHSLFSNQTFRQRLEGMVTGTSKSHQRVSPPALRSLEVLIGHEQAFAAFGEIVMSLMQKVLANRAENQTLAHTRDLLLPRLMSGEIRVAEAERKMEETL